MKFGGVSSKDDEEAKEVSRDEAIDYYKREFARYGCQPTNKGLEEFFNRCQEIDGYVDSERVKEICYYAKRQDMDKFWIGIKDVKKFFSEISGNK